MVNSETSSALVEVTASSSAQALTKQLSKIPKLSGYSFSREEEAYKRWESATVMILARIFGEGSTYVQEFRRAGGFMVTFHLQERAAYQVTLLEALVDILQLEAQSETRNRPLAHPTTSGHSVFIVHGRDDGRVRHEVARFLAQLRHEARILHELPSKGLTVIEKFEDYADVAFAIVLLTPDDRGGLSRLPYDQQNLRARQNVIFELGYFIGKLGRDRVVALYSAGVEIPSDYAGILYVPFDESGAWKVQLAQEMKAAGLAVDLNLVVGGAG